MPFALEIQQTGGPDVMELVEIAIPLPTASQVLVKHTCIGLNFIDIYFRTGLYPAPHSPFTPGHEAAGVVEAVGKGVKNLKIGDRVVYTHALGSYATHRILPADRVVRLPDAITDEIAAASFLKGLTAQYLCRTTYHVKSGDWCVVHAAAGGVGQLLTQWIAALGGHVVATAGSEAKLKIARAAGAQHTFLLEDGWAAKVKELASGQGAHVVYDSIGKDTFPASLDALRPRGLWVSYGNASGSVPAFEPAILSQKGSLFMTRPTLGHYIATRDELTANAQELFGRMMDGTLSVSIGHRYHGLAEIAQAHSDMEARKTTGSSVVMM